MCVCVGVFVCVCSCIIILFIYIYIYIYSPCLILRKKTHSRTFLTEILGMSKLSGKMGSKNTNARAQTEKG